MGMLHKVLLCMCMCSQVLRTCTRQAVLQQRVPLHTRTLVAPYSVGADLVTLVSSRLALINVFRE